MRKNIQSLLLVVLLLSLVGCSTNVTISPYPNPPVATVSSTPTLHPLTPIPFGKNRQATPTRYYPPTLAPDFGQGDIAEIASQDALGHSDEELFDLLVSQWLEKYKTGTIPNNTISDYRIDEIGIDQGPKKEFTSVAWVYYSIQIVGKHSGNWSSLITRSSNATDPWEHLLTVFGIYRDGDSLKLRMLPGWGT